MKSELILAVLMFLAACQTSENKSNLKTAKIVGKSNSQTFDIPVDKNFILKDFKKWYAYDYNNIRLSQNFIGLDSDSALIDKTSFLNRLKTGSYIPFKIKILNNVPVYKLYKTNTADDDIISSIKQKATLESFNFQMEGKQLPDYDFTDIHGKKYDKKSTKNNIILLKCWFINCVSCVKEFPELNALVDKYQHRKDILFISLAMDTKSKLVAFLKTKEFKYAIIPNKRDYMTNKLKVPAYPMHILIDEKGEVIKVTNSIEEILPFFEKEVSLE